MPNPTAGADAGTYSLASVIQAAFGTGGVDQLASHVERTLPHCSQMRANADAVFRARPLPLRIVSPPVSPGATSYFLRPAFWPALLRPPACFRARLAAQ